MYNNTQFREVIIRPTLDGISRLSQQAEDLLVMVMSWESKGGTFVKQVGGPALGPYGMEPATHDDIWNAYLPYCDKLTYDLLKVSRINLRPTADILAYNLIYATAMARIHFCRFNEPIPSDLENMAQYCKKYWNTANGKAKPEDYLNTYKSFIGEQNAVKKRDFKKDL